MADDEIDLSAGYAKAPAPAGGMDLSAGFVQGQDKLDLSAGFQASKPQQAAPQPTPPPQDYIHAGPATPSPRVPEEGKQSTGDWLLDALLSPNTLIGHLLHPIKEPSKQEKVESKMSGMPVMGQRPLIDPSVGIEEPFTKGIVRSLGGMTAPAQMPFLAAPSSKVISGLFGITTVPQLAQQYESYQQAKASGDDARAKEIVGEMTATGLMGTLATLHSTGYAERLAASKAADVNSKRLALLSTLPPERQFTVLQDMGVIPKSVSLEDALPSMARAAGGKLQIGADVGRLTEILGSSMYSNRGAPVVVKELLQNALDAVRPNNGKVIAHLNKDNRTFDIRDTGVGMTPDQIYTVFTDIGASGKAQQAGASGGFGLAKIAPFMIPERMDLTTTSLDPSTGKRITTSFSSTPADIVSGNVEPKVTFADPSTPTGTHIRTYFPDPKPGGQYDPHNFYDAERFLSKFLGSSNIPGTGMEFATGRGPLEPVHESIREAFSVVGPGGTYTFSLGNKLNKGEAYPDYEIHNNGLYQFTHSQGIPGADKVSIPERIVVDIKPNVQEGAIEYPFTTNREGVTRDAGKFIQETMKKQLVDPKLAEVTDLIKAKYNSMPMMELPNGQEIPIYDSGARLTVGELNTLRNSSALKEIAATIHSVASDLRGKISSLPASLFGGGEGRPMGSTVGRIGLLLADNLEKGGSRTYGVYVPDPHNPANQASVFINPFGWAALAKEGGGGVVSSQLFHNPDFAASQLYHTIVHELVHDAVKGHNEQFTTAIMNLDSFLGINAKIGSLEDLANVFQHPDKPDRIRSDFDELLQIYRESRGRPENEKDILGGESLAAGGEQRPESPAPASTPNASERREEAVRPDYLFAGRGGPAQADIHLSPLKEGAGREAVEGELATRLGELHSILPDFQKAIGGEEEAAPSPVEGHGAEVEEQPPVISRAVDDDMAAGGVQVVKRGRDMNLASRGLGSLIQTAQAWVRSGHELGQTLYSFTSIGSDAIKAIAANSMDTMKVFINDAKKLVNREEWSEQVARLMDQGVIEQPPGVPDHVWKATQAGQALVEAGRVKLIAAKRAELHDMRPSLSADKIIEFYPDDWGKKGAYYPHAHPGTWTITEHTGVDEKGNDIWEPIDSPTTSWRALSEFQAKAVAEGWLKDHPGSTLRVRQDTVTAAANSLTDRARLMALTDRVREATTTITHGGDPEEVMDQLYNQSAATAYGPRSATKRQFGATMRRETNLEGYTRDIDDFKDHLLATERYAVLAPVRQKMMKIRNFVADLAGAKQVQSPSDLPTLKFPPQYANLLGRMDSFIEGLEGTPGLSDAATKYILNGLGLDPNLANKAMGPVQQLWATMKLGMNPARVLSHGLQSLWAVNTVIGPEATFQGYVHGYDPQYNWLIHDLGIEHAGNMSDLEGMRTYAGAYFGRGSTPIDWSKGTLKIARDIGLSPLTMGINFSSHTAAVGAYIQGLERGMESAQARNYARDVLDRTMGVYHAADNPALLRQLPSTVTQFKPFMMKTGQFILNLRGAEIPRFMAAAVLLGGVSAPIISQLSSLVHLATGGDTIADYLKRKYPKLARGIFGSLGLDVPSAVGPGDFSLYRTNAPMGGVAGPLGSDILAGAKAGIEHIQDPLRRSADQDVDSFIRGLSPQGRRMWDFGVRMTTKPQTIDPRTGSKILGDVTTREQLELLMGFTPLRMAEERESHEYIRNKLEEAKDKRGFFVDKLAENQLELMRPQITDSQRADLLKETIDLQRLAVEYNQGNKLIPAVRDRIREMLQERLMRDLKHAPKPMRPEIYNEMMRFKQENQ